MNKWKVIVEDLAQADLKEIYEWYELKREGLGLSFFSYLDEAIIKIERNPGHASFYDEKYRSISLKKFPYGVIFLTDEISQTVYIIAITHLHRKPSWFQNRNKK